LTYLSYNLCLWLASPLLALWVAYRILLGRRPGLWDRLGFFPNTASSDVGPVVWFHAVSLGEVKTAAFTAKELRGRIPGLRVIFTSSTRTGYDEARRDAAPGDSVFYPPLDYAWICRRFLRRLRPNLVVVLETELWPNLFREVKRSGAGLLLVNGRISDRAFPRYRASRSLWRRVLANADALFVQSSRDAGRFIEIGAPAARVHDSGNLKYAMPPATTPLAEDLRAALAEIPSTGAARPLLIAGSTMPGEESLVLDAFLDLRREFPDLLLILAPRHPERFDQAAAEVHRRGIAWQRRTRWSPGMPLASGVFLLDTTGELASLYPLADAAFVGGTLVPTGGHNILEPAQAACPTVIGPSMENFREIAARFLSAPGPGGVPGSETPIRAGAVLQVRDVHGLTAALRYLFGNPSYSRRLGAAAQAQAKSDSGGARALLDEMEKHVRAGSTVVAGAPPLSEPAAAGRIK
jgi:3-deoxy-D-manno-octulosonic-acid transferase